MCFFKKKNKQKEFSLGFSLEQKHEFLIKEFHNLKVSLQVLKDEIKDLNLEVWLCKTICPKSEYRVLHRQPGSYIHSYEKDRCELEEKGWHIKRVSDCGRYEIWMPGNISVGK